MLCTLTVTDNIDKDGVARFPMGNCPIVDPKTGDVLIDSRGRRSYTTSLAYGPSIGKNIALGYLPQAYCEEGRQVELEYFNQKFPVQVERSEERRGGKECVDTGSSRWSPYH